MAAPLLESNCPGLELIARGKVRDLYRTNGGLLIVATDRLSAFDVVMTSPIPDKGRILTQLSLFWFNLLGDVCPNHLITADIRRMPTAVQVYADQLAGRTMFVEALRILPVEAIVRGYLSGSGWKEYRASGTVCGITLPTGLVDSSKLPRSLYTPSTKAALGAHDENIPPDQAAAIIGPQAQAVAATAVRLYERARDHAAKHGIIIADTKFEFGVDAQNRLVLADEVLTPDSSRFWPADRYAAGRAQDSFDKQYVRDYLESIHFDKNGGGIELPAEVVALTRDKYLEAFRIITGREPDL